MKFTEHNEIVMEKFTSMIIERIEKMQEATGNRAGSVALSGEAP